MTALTLKGDEMTHHTTGTVRYGLPLEMRDVYNDNHQKEVWWNGVYLATGDAEDLPRSRTNWVRVSRRQASDLVNLAEMTSKRWARNDQ